MKNRQFNRFKFVQFFFRFINGSTLLHTAAYFGVLPVVKALLRERVEVDLLDYKGATPLHRARDPETMKVPCFVHPCLDQYVAMF